MKRGRSFQGYRIPKVKTSSSRLRAKVVALNAWPKAARSRYPLERFWVVFCAKVRRHVRYYGVSLIVLHIEPVNVGDGSNRIVEIKHWHQAACGAYKNVRLVAAHTGMMSPADLEELLLRCPNMHADFKVLHSVGAINGFAHLHGVNDLDFRFFEDWAALMERFPDLWVPRIRTR